MIPSSELFLCDPAASSSLVGAVIWIEGVVLGTSATVIAVICVAVTGILMLNGRINVRRGMAVILGCFILFGSPAIVRGLLEMILMGTHETVSETDVPLTAIKHSDNYDPYAGASVIR